jgi:RNA polymerase sigma-70 factor (ECF subfamily)
VRGLSEREQIEEWFHLYHKELYNFLMYYTHSNEVDDMVQETFIKAIKGLKSFKMESSPRTWLYSIARNVGLDYLRKNKRVNERQFLSDEIEGKNVATTPDQIFQLNETKKELYEAIYKLKQSYQDVIILRGIKEFNIAETAAILNWSESKVRITFHRALKSLEKEMNKREESRIIERTKKFS